MRVETRWLGMIISASLFEAYLECPTKCWLRSRAEPSTGNVYAEWSSLQKATYCENALKSLLANFPESDRVNEPQISRRTKDESWRLATNVPLRSDGLETRLHALERRPPERRRPAQFIPYHFNFSSKVTKNNELFLAFDALVLTKIVGREVSFGKIVHGDRTDVLKVNLSALGREMSRHVTNVSGILAESSPPDLVLNPHCRQCEFQARCHASRNRRMISACYPGCQRRSARICTARASSRLPSYRTHFVRVGAAGIPKPRERNIITLCARSLSARTRFMPSICLPQSWMARPFIWT